MKDKKVKDLTLTSMFSAIILIMSLVPFLGYIPIVPGTVAAVIIHIPVIIAVFILPIRNSLLVGLVFGLGSLAVSFIRPETPLDYVFRNPLVSVLPRVLFTLASAYLARFILRLNRLKNGTLVIFSIVAVVTLFGISYANVLLTEQIASDLGSAFKDVYNISLPISLLLILVFLAFYFNQVINKKNYSIAIPSIFILSSLIHSILVVSMLGLFGANEMAAIFGNLGNAFYWLILINGLPEAIIAALIGSPILITLAKVNNTNLELEISGKKI